MSDILEMALEIRDKPADPEKARLIERKRAQTEQSALELRALLSPLAGQKVAIRGERGILHVRADQTAAFVEFVPNEKYSASASFDGRLVEEQRERPGKAATLRMTVERDEQGYVAGGFNLPAKRVKVPEDLKRYLAAVFGPLLEP